MGASRTLQQRRVESPAASSGGWRREVGVVPRPRMPASVCGRDPNGR